jgi:S1-C subfamily serine protease
VLGRPDLGEALHISVADPAAVSPTVLPPDGDFAPTVTVDAALPASPPEPAQTAERPGAPLRDQPQAEATVVEDGSLRIECGGRSYHLEPGSVHVIGRDPKCEVVSNNPNVSRRHARLNSDAYGWWIEDLKSNGGTFHDGERIQQLRLAGSMTLMLGNADSGERLVTKAAGTAPDRPVPAPAKSSRRGVLIGMTALLVLVVVGGLLAWKLTRAPSDDSLASGVVKIVVPGATGSGTIVDAKNGLILTNAHVVAPQALGQAIEQDSDETLLDKDPTDIQVWVTTGIDKPAEPKYHAKVLAVDGYLDLAVIKITKLSTGSLIGPGDLDGLTQINLADESSTQSGDSIRVIGYPGVDSSDAPSINAGEVSSPVQDDRLGTNRAWLNVSAEIRNGNSGGAAVDDDGDIVGVPTLTVTDAEGNVAKRIRPVSFARKLISDARNGRPYTSPYVTPLSGQETLGDVSVGAPSASQTGYESSCDGDLDPLADGLKALSVQINFSGFRSSAHQDLRVRLVSQPSGAEAEVVGEVSTGDQYPFSLGRSGCVTATLRLSDAIDVETNQYALVIDAGPNYTNLGTLSLSGGSSSGGSGTGGSDGSGGAPSGTGGTAGGLPGTSGTTGGG